VFSDDNLNCHLSMSTNIDTYGAAVNAGLRVQYFFRKKIIASYGSGVLRARWRYKKVPGFARWQRESAGMRLVHGAQNALRQGSGLLFMSEVAQARKTAYARFRLSRE